MPSKEPNRKSWVELITNDSRFAGFPPAPTDWLYGLAATSSAALYLLFHRQFHLLWKSTPGLRGAAKALPVAQLPFYSWLLTGLSAFNCRTPTGLSAFNRLTRFLRTAAHKFVSVCLAYWLIPATLFLIWVRYLIRYDWVGTSLHMVILLGTITAALFFRRRDRRTIREVEPRPFSWKYAHWDVRTYKFMGVVGALLTPLLFFSQDPTRAGLRANLESANLRGANLSGISLRDADLDDADLEDADLEDADLSDAHLSGANLRGANLRGAKLSDTDRPFSGAYLSGADLSHADLSGAYLYGAVLSGANLSEAVLRGANLRNTDLHDADLSGADLEDADLSDTDLRGADLRGTLGLTQSQLDKADGGDKDTRLPHGMSVRRHVRAG